MAKHLTGRRAHTQHQRGDSDTAPVSTKDYLAALAVGRIEARFPHWRSRQLEHIDNILGAYRAKVVQLEIERREVLARMQGS